MRSSSATPPMEACRGSLIRCRGSSSGCVRNVAAAQGGSAIGFGGHRHQRADTKVPGGVNKKTLMRAVESGQQSWSSWQLQQKPPEVPTTSTPGHRSSSNSSSSSSSSSSSKSGCGRRHGISMRTKRQRRTLVLLSSIWFGMSLAYGGVTLWLPQLLSRKGVKGGDIYDTFFFMSAGG